MSNATHTPGPWRWEYKPDRKRLALLGGVPRYDLTLLDFVRSGMQGGIARFRDPAFPGMNVMELPGKWAVAQAGREHHAGWFKLIDHPDAHLIAAAPDLLAVCKAVADLDVLDQVDVVADGLVTKQITINDVGAFRDVVDMLNAAIAKAEGKQ